MKLDKNQILETDLALMLAPVPLVVTKTLTLSTTWQTFTSGIADGLATGIYILKLYSFGGALNKQYDMTYSGMFTWNSGNCNEAYSSTIPLTKAGNGSDGANIEIRTTISSFQVPMKLEIRLNNFSAAAAEYTMTFYKVD